MFRPHAIKYNHFVPVTAIVRRTLDSGIIPVVHHLLKYPFITEIIVDSPTPLTVHDLNLDSIASGDVSVQVFSNEDLGSVNRFTACALASNEHCYLQDDLWLNVYLDSLYLNFQKHPDLVHANVRPTSYTNMMRWRFGNKEPQLHAGYADFRYGAFVPRSKVQMFLTQTSRQGLKKSHLKHADAYFSVWTNQYPYLLANPLVANEDMSATTVPGFMRDNMYNAVRLLERALTLKEESTEDLFEKIERLPLQDRDARASCANDQCIFTTNINVFPHPESINFTTENIHSTSQLDAFYNEMDLPIQEHWLHRAYHRAVDGNSGTCWNTYKAPKTGDYFGLNLVGTIRANRVLIHTRKRLSNPETAFKLSILVSNNGNWVECKTSTLVDQQLPRRIALIMDCPNKQPFRAIRIAFTQDQSEAFDLCGLGLDNFIV